MGILFNLGKPLAQGLLPKAPSKQYKDKKSNKDRETKQSKSTQIKLRTRREHSKYSYRGVAALQR